MGAGLVRAALTLTTGVNHTQGGASGTHAEALLPVCPAMRATILDLPPATEISRRRLAPTGASFSTKGDPGRGIGTHSVKLLTEKYLNGEVRFVSRPGEGTTFRVTVPKAVARP